MLELAIGGNQGLAVPKPDVVQGARGGGQIRRTHGLAGLQGERAHPFQAESFAGGLDAARQVRRFQGQLTGLNQKPLGQWCQHPLTEGQAEAGDRKRDQHSSAQPALWHWHQKPRRCEKEQESQDQAQGKTHMQIHPTGTCGDTAPFHHEVERGEGRARRSRKGQNGQLGLQHLLLLARETAKAEIGERCPLAQRQEQTSRQAHGDLGNRHAQKQMDGRQAQHSERQIQSSDRISLAEGGGQQGRQPETPTPGHGRGGGGQGRREHDAQAVQRPDQ